MANTLESRVKTKTGRPPLTESEVDNIVETYKRELSRNKTAEETGYSLHTIRKYLRFRSVPFHESRGRKPLNEDEIAYIIRIYSIVGIITDAARITGHNECTVSKYVRKHKEIQEAKEFLQN